ncbi:protein FAR1-RELATED SEQUENCE 5-like isoform X2 [Rosa chinensis]|nr:protein FAR1-RELATED SEQUENCE 5-like isoform X2 [Rosa chinensis]
MDDMMGVYFPTVEEAEKFYSLYSRILGFSVRRDRLQKEGNGLVVRRQWVCSKQGLASIKCRKQKGVDKNKTANNEKIGEQKKSRRNIIPRGVRYTRVNCPVSFSVRYCKDKELYRVTKFVQEHNHDLAKSHEVQFLRSNRRVEDKDVAQVECLRRAQVHTSRAYEQLVEQAGGHDGVGFLMKDLYNKIYELRKNAEMDGDAQAAITWMNMRGMESEEFCCRYSLDEEGRLANLFWRDYQSFLDYSAYSDVVIMDSTYKTNLYGKPLVVFVGCNNHRATVVFGFALIRDEREDTYTWVFENFLESMDYKQPSSILTDGDESIRKVVERVMPIARHRLCAWHIGRNISQNVKDVADQKSLSKMIYSSMCVSEWEAAWQSIVVRNGLSDNAWVISLYNKRERWAEAFFRGHFFGGMCSTQRVEGMHAKLKKEIGRHTRLCEVMPRMERTLGRIRNRVLYDNFRSKNGAPVYETHMRGIEEDACRLFTHDIFVMIKSQILFERRFVLVQKVPFPISDTVMFYLAQYDRPERRWCVEFHSDPTNPTWLCSCKLFESDGIPCGHIFCVLKDQLLSRYPASLITKRWTKCVSDSTVAPKIKVPDHDKSAQVARYSALISEVSKACLNYSFSDEGFRVGMIEFARLVQSSSEFKIDPPMDTSRVPPSRNVVRDPKISRTKGMPSNPTTNTENANKEQRLCGKCFMPGHNRRTCTAGEEGVRNRGYADSHHTVPCVEAYSGSVPDVAPSVPNMAHLSSYVVAAVPDPPASVQLPADLPYHPTPCVSEYGMELDFDDKGASRVGGIGQFPFFVASQHSSSFGILPFSFNLNQTAPNDDVTQLKPDCSYPPPKWIP